MTIISILGLIAAIAFVVFCALKNISVAFAGPVAALIIALTGGMGPVDYMNNYASGYAALVTTGLFLYSIGMILSKLMEAGRLSHSIAYWITDRVGGKHIALVCILTCWFLQMGGCASGWIIMYPIGLIMCSKENYDRGFLAGACMCAGWSFAASMPLGATIPNNLISPVLGTTTTAGLIPGGAYAAAVFIANVLFFEFYCAHTKKKGMQFNAHELVGKEIDRSEMPPIYLSVLPIVLVLVLYNVWQINAIISMAFACLLTMAIGHKYITKESLKDIWFNGFLVSLPVIAGVAAMNGMGAIFKLTPAFDFVMGIVDSLPLHPYIVVVLFLNILGACLGAASATISTGLTILGERILGFAAQGYDIGVLHRLTAIGAQSTSALPNAGTVMAAFVLYKTNFKESYFCIFMTCVAIPLICTWLIAVPLSLLGFN